MGGVGFGWASERGLVTGFFARVSAAPEEVAAARAGDDLVAPADVVMDRAITLTPEGAGTRVHLRLRLGPVRRKWLANSVGEVFDLVTIAGMAAGLRERLAAHP